MKQVWILWGNEHPNKPWIEGVFIDKVLAESALRHMSDTYDEQGCIYWIQEKEITT